jgi:ethylbenzene dehydrogenase
MRNQTKRIIAILGGCALTGLVPPLFAAVPADWSKIPAKKVVLFYPGQSTYQWLRGPEHKKGANKKVEKGGACASCHEGEEAEIGKKIASGQRLEPAKLGAKNGAIELAVQAAHDDKNLYLRFQWKTKNDFPGSAYPFYRFDGKDWVKYGEPNLSAAVRDGKQPAVYEDRLSIMLDDGKVPHFKQQGCWLTCHDGMRDTQKMATKEQVQANALLAKKEDVRKYLPATRTDELATWDKTKSADDVAKLKAAGAFVELMQWRAHRSNPAGMADDGYVLEYRNFDEGKNMYSANFDKDKKQPKYMFDAGKAGMKAQRAETMRDVSKPQALVVGQNAVAFDANAGWKEGDLLSQYYVNRADASGSAADNSEVAGTWSNGMWTVVWKRPLDTGHPQDDKILKVGGYYNVGFAVHDDNITTRGHHVSFPLVLGIGAAAGITAVKVP